MTIVDTRVVCGGVDTHLDFHVAAALDGIGGLLGVESFEASEAGYRKLLSWLESFGAVIRVGVEGTGSYGAGLARFLHDHNVARNPAYGWVSFVAGAGFEPATFGL